MKFRKRPVVIEAVKYDGTNYEEIRKWAGFHVIFPERMNCLSVRTLEGNMLANPGDYIIRGVKGEFYPCKPDVFEATYDAEIDKKERGVFHKYNVDRVDGKPINWCFVLEDKDPFAVDALRAYADACKDEYPQLSEELHRQATQAHFAITQAAIERDQAGG